MVMMNCVDRDKCQTTRRKRRRWQSKDEEEEGEENMIGPHNCRSHQHEHQQTVVSCGPTYHHTDQDMYDQSTLSPSTTQQQQQQAQFDLITDNSLVKSALNHSTSLYYNFVTIIQNHRSAKTTMLWSPHLRRKLFLVLLVVYCCCCLSHNNHLVSCQRIALPGSESPPTLLITSQSSQQPQNFANSAAAAAAATDGTGAGGLVEARADNSPMKQQANAIDHLVNLLNSYASQQSALNNNNVNNQNQRRPSLPTINSNNVPQRISQVPPVQVSTPAIPFNGPQFQSSRRLNFNPNQPNSNNNNQLFVSSSSPATPYLTLNRIASLANPQLQSTSNNGQQQNNNRGLFGNHIQPINTIPLGSQSHLHQPSGNRSPMMPPPRIQIPAQRQQQQQQFGQQQMQQLGGAQLRAPSTPLPLSLPPVPALLAQNTQPIGANPVKPISGFAPSGPPPSLAANNAMVVVQSPPNAIGLAPPVITQQPPELSLSSSASPNNSSRAAAPSVEDNKPTTTASSSDESSDDTGSNNNQNSPGDDKSAQPAITTTTTTSGLPNTTKSSSTEPSTTLSADQVQENKNAANTTAESSWNPVGVTHNKSTVNDQVLNRSKVTLAPSPDIVTVPPGYNPDNPNNQAQNYDISVSAQMGTPIQRVQPPILVVDNATGLNANVSHMLASSQATTLAPTIAPTAVTTIIWSPPASEIIPSTSSSQIQIQSTKTVESRSPTQTAVAHSPSRIRDNSLNDEPTDSSVVYGKPQARDSKPTPPHGPQVSPSPVTGQASIESSVPAPGRPFIQPVQMENQVRPFSSGAQSTQLQQQAVLKSNHGHSVIPPFRLSRPLNGQSPMHVGSGFTITANGNQTMPTGDIQDYVAGQPPLLVPNNQMSGSFHVNNGDNGSNSNHLEPTISAQGGQDPASFDLSAQDSTPSASSGSTAPPHNKPLLDQSTGGSGNSTSESNGAPSSLSPAPTRIRRPTFKPKPAVPPIRIDSCIVGDDSSCDQSHNERCVTEYGISSCHCKPGYARLSQLRGYCSPVSSLQLSMKIDRLSDDRRLVFNHTLDNSNTEEYQYLEFETIQALASAFQQTSLAKQFMGTRVNKFFERKGKVWVNMSVNFEANNLTKADRIQNVAAQELLKVAQIKQRPLGDSTIMLDGSKEAISRLVDVNECANRDLNDCSKYATCSNEFGGFQCQCMAGYEDKYQSVEDKGKHGRICLGCSPSYCSNRGECSIVDGKKQCKCRPGFNGARCDIDSEVLAVVIGGSLVGVIILIITFWCLFVFNRRWKREQKKMDAMSATSGLTFNYVNSSTNSLMSPSSRVVGGLHRSGGHQVGAMAANYGQRFGAAIVGAGSRGGQHYAPDQQAIIGSTSSGSSAASQPIGCNPYAAGYQYENAGLLIAPASGDSSEQTSPSSNSYRGILAGDMGQNTTLSQMAGNAYTLSGHHHHHHPHVHAHSHHPSHTHNMHHHTHHGHTQNNKGHHGQITQFHPAADYRTINTATMHCPVAAQGYDARWRTLQQDNSKQAALVGYYLSSDMLVGQQQQHHHHQQQMVASPQRELCIDTGGNNHLNGKSRKQQQGRGASGGFQTLRSRSQSQLNSSMYHQNSDYDHGR